MLNFLASSSQFGGKKGIWPVPSLMLWGDIVKLEIPSRRTAWSGNASLIATFSSCLIALFRRYSFKYDSVPMIYTTSPNLSFYYIYPLVYVS